MSLSVPLAVRIRTPRGRDQHITAEISDLVFSSASPKGFEAATFSLYRPIHFEPSEVEQFARVWIYDAQSGATVWEGILQDPGRSLSDGGAVWELSAVGGSAHLEDNTSILYYVDTDPNSWAKTDPGGTRAGEVQQETDSNAAGDPALVLRIPQGTAVDGAIPSRVVAAHRGISVAGMKLARIAFDWDTGLTAATLTLSLYAGTYGTGPADVPYTATFNTAGANVGRIVGSWTNGRNWPILRFHYTGASGNVTADTWWLEITNLVVRTMMYAKNGVEITDYSAGTNLRYAGNVVYADQVVEDLLGRILSTVIDGANATIGQNTYAIDHLIYPDGVTPAKVLDDLMAIEFGYTYHVWESNPDNDKFRFEWVPYPTVVRYEALVNDGFTAPGSGASLYNKVIVRYRNRGVTQRAIRTQTVPLLAAAGYDRTGFIDLGDEASSSANANQIGDNFLAEHKVPVNGGRITITQPVLDLVTGRMVDPWMIRPGNLIRVRGIESYPDALNNDGRDGVTVFKIAAHSYSSGDAAATLDLDTYSPTLARAVAALMRRPVTRRR